MIKLVKKLTFPLSGTITIPPDKSLSHRAAMLLSLTKGKSLIHNFSIAKDPASTLSVLEQLGVEFDFLDKSILQVNSKGSFKQPQNPLNCGNSGTTMRLISGLLSAQNFKSVLIGDESLSKRPMKRIVEPLTLMGAQIHSDNFHAPLTIIGKNLHSIDYNLPISSAQVKSAILLAGLFADGKTSITEPFISRNHTELMLKYLGADISTTKNTVTISKSTLEPKDIHITGDISTAAYFIAAALIVENSNIILKNVGLNSTRTGFSDVCKLMGANIEILDLKEVSGETVGDLRVKYSDLKSCEITADIVPRLIDELPIIAVLATQAKGITKITGAQDLRNKESDRIKSTVNMLKSIGANIEELTDGFVIEGKTELSGGTEVESQKDHRLIMSAFVAGLICKNPILIKDYEWVDISTPEFENLFEQIIPC